MASDISPIGKQGVVTLSYEAWAQGRQRTDIIGPLAVLEVVGHEAADAAAQALGLSRRQVYVLIHRARQGTGLFTDLAPGRSGGGKGKGRLPESVERIIRELLQKRFLTKQKRSLTEFHREVAQACKAHPLRVLAAYLPLLLRRWNKCRSTTRSSSWSSWTSATGYQRDLRPGHRRASCPGLNLWP